MQSISDYDITLSKMTPTISGQYIYHFDPARNPLPAEITPFAQIFEPDGVTSVIPLDQAKEFNLTAKDHTVYTRIVLLVESNLLSPGLTCAVASQFAAQSIPCNVLASVNYDHLMVPEERTHEAMNLLSELSAQAKSWCQS